ncbi:MAG TPA: FtsX-like permease family protein [Mycobacteriales bacterium]|nr:FtsX-like permease family protein [Mycobacteriales bacterium]
MTLKGLAAHKLRLAMTALAIVLGVGFVAGTYVLTDTINKTFTDLFTQTTKGVDVAIRTKETFSVQGNPQRAPLPAALLDQVRGINGVRVAEGNVGGYAQFVGRSGKPVTTGGAPTLGVSVGSAPELQQALTLREGRLPAGPDDVAVDAATARKQGFHIGDRVKILFQGPPREFTVVGVLGFGQADNLAGATLAGFDLATAQQVLNRVGTYDEIDIVAASGVSPETLRDQVRAVVDPRYEVLTGTELAADQAKAVGQFTKFINYALLAFAFVALFVGSFIIVNTFSIILAQRTRELALLRCLGALRRQVLRSVLVEALIVGLIASVIGLGVGVAVAIGLKAVFKAVGADLPSTTLEIQPRTIVVALLVGVVVTVTASLLPALRATRVSPVAALQQEAVAPPARAGRRRTIIGALVTLAGVGLLLTGLFADQGNRLANVASGAVVIFLGVGILSPLVARPLARLLGWPFAHWAGEAGKLARDNAMRSPRRTASTAAALMIGLALVSLVTIFAASVKASVHKVLDQTIAADYILSGPSNGGGQGFSPEVVTRLSQQPEVDSATGVRINVFKLDGKTQQVAGVDPISYGRTVRTDTTSGSLSDLTSGGIAVRENTASDHGWKVGDTIVMEFPVGGTQAEPIRAIYEDNQLNGPFLLALPDYERHYADQLDTVALVKARSGVAPDVSRAAVDRVVADFPSVQVKDQAEYKQQQSQQIDQVLLLFYVLLALAVIIAVIGIINTLALSVLERIRELGLLRALGMTKRQLRAMVRWEAVIIAVLGAVLGLAVGGFFGWTLVRALHSQGITEFAVPIPTLVGFVVAAALAGVLAAVFPARRASKIDVLRAITTE